jgi:hypothetical protein
MNGEKKPQTPNTKILIQVRDSFDTDKLGAALSAIDRLAEMRGELKIVYAKARDLVDDLRGLPGEDDRRPVWEVADGIMAAFGDCVENLKGVEHRGSVKNCVNTAASFGSSSISPR